MSQDPKPQKICTVEALRALLQTHPEWEAVTVSWELAEELVTLENLFDLQWEADQRAIKLWQAAHPGNDLVWPDRCDMVVWLMGELEKARAGS